MSIWYFISSYGFTLFISALIYFIIVIGIGFEVTLATAYFCLDLLFGIYQPYKLKK